MSYVSLENNNKKSSKYHNELPNALREFRKKVKTAGILQDLQKHESYMSPSEKRKFKEKEAIRRKKREERKQEWYVNKNK